MSNRRRHSKMMARVVLLVAMALVASGCTFAWGSNFFGSLGNGTGADSPQPALIDPVSDHLWLEVAAGAQHSCAIRLDGTLWCWGRNQFGQVGDGTNTDRVGRVQVGTATDWIDISAGDWHTCGLRGSASGALIYCWGRNSDGQIGDNSTTNRNSPIEVNPIAGFGSIVAGEAHTCVVGTALLSNALYCWGDNSQGQIGDGTTTDRLLLTFLGTGFDTVAPGGLHTCATTTSSGLLCWGDNSQGQIGDGTFVDRLTPTATTVPFDQWTDVVAGTRHTCATQTLVLDTANLCWGDNTWGQVGDGTTTDRSTPTTINTISTEPVADWAAGTGHSCATLENKELWCWGLNNFGQLGNGNTASQTSPIEVGGGSDWATVATTDAHTCATTIEFNLRQITCWGFNGTAALGDGTTTNRSVPTLIEPTYSQIAAGDYHACRLRVDDTLWCWGRNNFGQLGDGTTTDRPTPVQIGATARWSEVSAGASHTCATRTDGTLWCWGSNNDGELGLGNTVDVAAPSQVGSDTNWEAPGVGRFHSCATKTNGTLWCWGSNSSGQTGINLAGPITSPGQVSGSSDWAAVSGGGFHTCAVRNAGTLWCWGENVDGQLGNGTTGSFEVTPGQVGTQTNWGEVTAGNQHTCATRTDTTLWCWGRNDFGELGDGTTIDRSSPTQIGAGTSWRTVSTHVYTTCAIATAGTLWCWGDNSNAQIGDGTTTDRDTPTQIGALDSWYAVAPGLIFTTGIVN